MLFMGFPYLYHFLPLLAVMTYVVLLLEKLDFRFMILAQLVSHHPPLRVKFIQYRYLPLLVQEKLIPLEG
jgi:hypothetical protein